VQDSKPGLSSLNQFQQQTGEAAVRDESRNPDGSVRDVWRYLLDGVNTLGAAGIGERHEKARRILRDDGATYNVYGSEHAAMRPWELDLVPFVIGSDEWAKIESGLLERAELFNLLLRDLYGPRDLIRTGVIPPEAVFAHGGFLRACSGIRLQGEHDLIIHSVDMVRTPSGEMCVFADRSQSPSGAGYALENRTVMSRVLPSLFRDSHVHRLAHFFQRLRAKLGQLAPNVDEPRVVVLTPGALNETHFEHAYLANYLGYPLVQSGDLMVRNGFVWMKSLEGLMRVDVILRRVDDWFCDPLELKSDSQLGVPGLLAVARQNRVAIANPLGSGVLENPVLLRYLPQIGKRLLGREPRLKSVATYWCGDRKDMAYVMANLDQLIIKPIFRGMGRSQTYAEMSSAERTAMLQQVQAQPQLFVAQERIVPSHVPTVIGGQLQPRPAILRTFAVASESSYSIMPGGLTRVGLTLGSPLISNQLGSINKDTWVVASEPERPVENVPLGERRPQQQQSVGLPSRVVENLFWLGRYAERAEASLRVLRTTFVMLNGAEILPRNCRHLLLRAVTEVTTTFPGFSAQPDLLDDPEKELLAVVLDGSRMGSVRACLQAMLNCAEESKELLSSDTLRVINDIRDVMTGLDTALEGGLMSAPEEALDPLVTALMALSGLSQESMIRGVGWRFMEIGRRLERGLQIITLIRALLVRELADGEQATVLLAMLQVLEVLITYRRRYRARMDIAQGLELTLIDTSNPRSLIYQFEQLQAHIANLPEVGISSRELQAEQRALLEANTTLRLSHLVDLARPGDDSGRRDELDQVLSRLYHLLTSIGNVVSDKYFDHRVGPQQLVRAVWEG
jgi:uncharacterized circularly permuted ATP-grasp superfamily protein/uncharacterized alpha-E superfamily protein